MAASRPSRDNFWLPLQRRKAPASESGRYKGKTAGKDAGVPRITYGVMARTRRGLPEPLRILRGAAMTTAPVGGN